MSERQAAAAFSRDLDRWLANEVSSVSPGHDGLATVAERLSRLPELLPAVDGGFERRMLARAQRADRCSRGVRPRWRAAALGLAAILLLMVGALLYPPGMATLAGFAARFGLGAFVVEVTPQPGVGGETFVTSARERLGTVQEAEALMGFDLVIPTSLPSGYTLQDIGAVSYEGMPVWIPQPFYVELRYGPAVGSGLHYLTVREFSLAVSEGLYLRRIREVSFAAQDISSADELSVRGAPAVLLTMPGGAQAPVLRRLIWQQGDVMLELLSQTLDVDEMLCVAEQMAGAG